MRRATADDIRKLALRDPTVAACLAAQAAPHSGIGWDTMLMALVCYLVEEKAALQALGAPPSGRPDA